jgi:hypothetical protein
MTASGSPVVKLGRCDRADTTMSRGVISFALIRLPGWSGRVSSCGTVRSGAHQCGMAESRGAKTHGNRNPASLKANRDLHLRHGHGEY